MMDAVFNQAKTIYSSTPSDPQCKYQPGGNLFSITGDCVTRTTQTGNDKMGRFSWATMRGKRDEGILIISAYRVCQDANSRAGAFTAYQQQYTMLREAGNARPKPRQQILTDIQTLIDIKRKEGYRPILMLDANGDIHHPTNGDIHHPKKPDIGMQEFIQRTNLIDACHQKFHDSPCTYMWGTKRLDYILVDPALTQANERIGYLGTHDSRFRLDKSVPTTTLPSLVPRSTLLLRRNSGTLIKYNLLSSITIRRPHRPIGHGDINKKTFYIFRLTS
jgi:hypothetical protein